MLISELFLQYYICVCQGKPLECNVLLRLTMKERRLLWQLTLLLFAFLSTLLVWHFLSIATPYTQVTSILDVPVYVVHSDHYNFSYPVHLLRVRDYNLLVNYTFNFDILNLGCNGRTLLLVLVHSSPNNFKKRSVIRTTWGNENDNVKVYFVLGKPSDSDTQRRVRNENQVYKDLLQGSFSDSYRNLTYKHIVSLKYATYHCSQAKYILKTDDDVFVNMPLLKNFLTVDLSPFGASNVLFCTVKKDTKVLRSYRSKWRVGFEEYPLRTYPPYCPGWVILYSPDVVFTLYKAAQDTPKVFWIDDVHITGTLAERNNITHTDIRKFVILDQDQKFLVERGIFPKYPFLFGQYDLTETEIKALWARVLSHSTPRSILLGSDLIS